MLRGAENRLWNNNFQLDDNNQPQYPLMTRIGAPLKDILDREVENMVKVGFLLGKKEQRPEIKKTGDRFTLSFLMPKKSQPGDKITIPVISGKGKKAKMVEIVIQIPITAGADNHTPKENEYLRDVPIRQDLNGNVYDNLKAMKSGKDVDTEFKPTYIKASDYVGEDTQKDLDKLVKPGKTQQYFISNAKIIPQDGNKFIFKHLTSFNKNSPTLVFDIYVLVDLTLRLNLKGPKDKADDTFVNKASRGISMAIINGPKNCPEYMTRAKEGASALFTTTTAAATRVRQAVAARLAARRDAANVIQRVERGRRRRGNILSGRANVRRGGGKKKTRKRKCHKKASRKVMRCWKKKSKRKFKKCWKKGRKTYKKCKKWKKAEKKLKSCKRKKKKTRKKKKQKGGYGLPYEHWYMEEIDN